MALALFSSGVVVGRLSTPPPAAVTAQPFLPPHAAVEPPVATALDAEKPAPVNAAVYLTNGPVGRNPIWGVTRFWA